jgi:trigger factor
VFEVFPEVQLGDLSTVEIEKITAAVDDEAIERTVDILRKQRRTFSARAATEVAASGDRVNIDFVGKIDGEAFEGGNAEGFAFLLGEGRMLPEFEEAVLGMKAGESKTFPLNFPADYHGQDVAGKTADFMVTLNSVEAQNLPEINEELVQALGVAEGTVEALRADIRKNLDREVKQRLQARNKQLVLEALAKHVSLDLPKAVVQAEIERLEESTRADLKQRGIKDADKTPIPQDMFQAQAEQRVKLGLVVGELVRAHNLQATQEQVGAYLEEMASSYEQAGDVVRWYRSDNNRMREIEGVVLENNVTEFVQSQAKVSEKQVSFTELMGQS